MRNKENYSEDWFDIIRPQILKRDNYRCKHCNVMHRKCYIFKKNGQRIRVTETEAKEAKKYGEKAYKVYLQIAHLDRNPKNNEKDNLVSLCPKCHLNYDREINMLSRKMNKNNNG